MILSLIPSSWSCLGQQDSAMGMALKLSNESGAFNAMVSKYHCLITLWGFLFIVKNHFKLQGSAKALCNYKMCVCVSVLKS